MKSLRTFLLATAAVFAAAGARAEYLLWTMDWTQVANSDYAQVAVLNADGSQTGNFLVDSDTGITQTYRDTENPTVATETKSTITAPANSQEESYKYAIIVYDSAGNALKKGEAMTYSQLQSAGYIWGSDGGMNAPSGTGSSTAWSPTTYGAVPEPATGTLLVVGSLLLFRRRKQA